jgi:hypothetical protein
MRLLCLLSILMESTRFSRFLVFWTAVMAFLFYCLVQH